MGYVYKNMFLIRKVLEREIPFCENMGFPNGYLCYGAQGGWVGGGGGGVPLKMSGIVT